VWACGHVGVQGEPTFTLVILSAGSRQRAEDEGWFVFARSTRCAHHDGGMGAAIMTFEPRPV